jgi:hypothetical protein
MLSPLILAGSNSGISLDPPVGTRDFYPEDLRLRSWLFHNFRETAVRKEKSPAPTLPCHALDELEITGKDGETEKVSSHLLISPLGVIWIPGVRCTCPRE